MSTSTLTSPRKAVLRAGLQAAADALYRRNASQIPEDQIDDYVRLNWLEWWGGRLQLTPVGENICRQLSAGID